MALGAFHQVTGILHQENGQHVLRMDHGNYWQLDILSDVENLMGHKVNVEGIQSSFDMLDVHRIWKHGDIRPLSPWESLENIIRMLRRG